MYYSIKKRLISHPGCAMEYLRRFIAHRRWACPHCGCIGKPHRHAVTRKKVVIYQCSHCSKTFSELYGTIFHRSKIPISKWMLSIIEWIESTGSVSASELQRKLNISYPSAWKILMKIRIFLSQGEEDMELLKNVVEGDEAWFGKKENQDIVLGLVERGRRKLRLFLIPNVKEATLLPLVEKYVKTGSKFFTDQHVGYLSTGVYYQHQTTCHSKGQFAKKTQTDNVHSNTIEQIWGDIKGIIRTIHHGISKKYRRFYLAQYIFKYQFIHTTNLFFKTLSTLFTPRYCLY